MEFIQASDSDIPQIISVLKSSLGEEELPISEKIWYYKHRENPFGKSVVLIARDGDRIAGVRAFMRWSWQYEQKKYSALRAVDTATHPDYQGKGIFKNLTLKAVRMCMEKGDNFIFNTPNDQSRPGYLKMGWKPVDNIQVGLKPAINSFWKISTRKKDYKIRKEVPKEDLDELCLRWNRHLEISKSLFTPKSCDYLHWRYENNPLQKYQVFASQDLYIAAYVKKRKGFKELRISECITRDTNRQTMHLIRRTLRKWSSSLGVQVISYAPQTLNLGHLSLKGNFGPVLTIKDLNLTSTEASSFINMSKWNYSLGDLELF